MPQPIQKGCDSGLLKQKYHRIFHFREEVGEIDLLDPFGAPLKCSDFKSWAEAQAVFIATGGPTKDRHTLDPDGNGFACEDLKK